MILDCCFQGLIVVLVVHFLKTEMRKEKKECWNYLFNVYQTNIRAHQCKLKKEHGCKRKFKNLLPQSLTLIPHSFSWFLEGFGGLYTSQYIYIYIFHIIICPPKFNSQTNPKSQFYSLHSTQTKYNHMFWRIYNNSVPAKNNP